MTRKFIVKSMTAFALQSFSLLSCHACTENVQQAVESPTAVAYYDENTRINEVMADPVFGDSGRLLFPTNNSYWIGERLKDLRLTWYTHINPSKTVEVLNYLKKEASEGRPFFFNIYTEEEMVADSQKRNTGLFYFAGKPGSRFAVCNAGGGFAYVGAIHDSFPHAMEISKHGYHGFALIYRPGSQTACEDLARALSWIFAHAHDLGINTDHYSLWGGSAGARMAAWLGSYGAASFGGDDIPQACTVVMQYTGLSDYSRNDPPTYVCVGDSDGIASWRTMKARLDGMTSLGIPTDFHVYPGLGHGFGLGIGTAAEGWIDDAIKFWENNTKHSN